MISKERTKLELRFHDLVIPHFTLQAEVLGFHSTDVYDKVTGDKITSPTVMPHLPNC